MDLFSEYQGKVGSIKAMLEKEQTAYASRILLEIRKYVSEFGFHPEDVFPDRPGPRRSTAPKYYDPVSGKTWTGRGREPAWIRGRSRAEFEISRFETERN
ncbi:MULTISPECIES: H-NS histone family protein [Burkholderia]|uniref:H-NS histone family protein n=1 Tax=Burkholderia TaxID=32008 RepID=UPI00136DAA3E|nr:MULTISPECIES: H-NS histone family protein [Burkholderia]NBI50500.1 H-NS histone family protein [Burkholderia sp. ISTR5]